MAEGDYLPSVTAVRVVRDRVVHLTFDDGLEGEVDLGPHLWGPVFEELARDDAAFGKIFIDDDTIAWENGADMAPETLYDDVQAAKTAHSTTSH
jgi:hypothetical protein